MVSSPVPNSPPALLRWTRSKTNLSTTFEFRPSFPDPKLPAADLRACFAEILTSSTRSPNDLFELSGNFDLGSDVEFRPLPGSYNCFKECFDPVTGLLLSPIPLSSPYTRPCIFHSMPIDARLNKPASTPGILLPLMGLPSTDPRSIYNGSIGFWNFDFKATCFDPTEDTVIMGWGGEEISKTQAGGDGTASLSLMNCNLDAGQTCDWGAVYDWYAGKKGVNIIGGTLKFCRFGVSRMSGGGVGEMITNLQDIVSSGNANGSHSFGDSSAASPDNGGCLTLLMQRGGSAMMINCSADLTGLSAEYDPRATANPPAEIKYSCRRMSLISDWFFSTPGIGAKYTIARSRAKVISKGITQEYNEIDILSPTAIISKDYGCGSGPDGTYKMRQPKPPTGPAIGGK